MDLRCNPVYMYKMEDDSLLDIRHFGHNFLRKDFDICFEYKLCSTDSQNWEHILDDILRTDCQSIRANIDKILHHFALCNLHSIRMD